MALKSDHWIKTMALENQMIDPFIGEQVREGKISYGLSSYGYDFRVADEFKILDTAKGPHLDPKTVDEHLFRSYQGETCPIPGHSFALARTIEYFKIPRNVLALCTGKSTYARCGLLVNITPLEPEWEGHVTLAITNMTSLTVQLYANEGLGQVIFFEADEPCLTSYKDRHGKYQRQTGIVLSKIGD